MALVFKGAEAPFSSAPKLSLLTVIAAMVACPFGLDQLMVETEITMLLPLWLAYRKYSKQSVQKAQRIKSMYLLENGQQIICETYDGILQKLNILASDQYKIDADGNSVTFAFVNEERGFELKTDKATVVDLNLTDRIVKGICIDTNRRGNLYHRIYDRQ
jgi:hypothetical protein